MCHEDFVVGRDQQQDHVGQDLAHRRLVPRALDDGPHGLVSSLYRACSRQCRHTQAKQTRPFFRGPVQDPLLSLLRNVYFLYSFDPCRTGSRHIDFPPVHSSRRSSVSSKVDKEYPVQGVRRRLYREGDELKNLAPLFKGRYMVEGGHGLTAP